VFLFSCCLQENQTNEARSNKKRYNPDFIATVILTSTNLKIFVDNANGIRRGDLIMLQT